MSPPVAKRNTQRRGIRSAQARERRCEKQKEKRRWGRFLAKTVRNCPTFRKSSTLPHRGRDSPTTTVMQNDNKKKIRERFLLDAVINKTAHIVKMKPRTNLLNTAVNTQKHEEQAVRRKRDF